MNQELLKKKVSEKNRTSNSKQSGTANANEQHNSAGEFIKSATYGGLDGLCTTLIIAVSAIGANKSPNSVVALGLASLIGDGLGMAVADFLATKSDDEFMKEEEQREKQEYRNNQQAQKQEMISLYEQMGLESKVSKEIVDIISENEEGFLKIMMIEELQMIAGQQSPFTNSIVTFLSFAIFGLMPLIPCIIAKSLNQDLIEQSIELATIFTAIFFLGALGLAKAIVGGQTWYIAIPQTIIIGAIASAASFGIGKALNASD